MVRSSLLASAAVVVCIAAHADAQVIHAPSYPLNGTVPDGAFGSSVSGAGDVNNDGYDDFIIGAPGDNTVAHNAGAAFVYSGYDGAVLHALYGQSISDEFGTSVSAAGDVNNDGFDDLIVGAPQISTFPAHAGLIRVFSGLNGAVIYTIHGVSNDEYFGWSVAGAGDVNNDGFDDVIAGALEARDGKGQPVGAARVYSGVDGTLLYQFLGDAAIDHFGQSVDGAGDVNNDGFDDLIVGASNSDIDGPDAGLARVFSGANGTVLHEWTGGNFADQLGFSVAAAGDVNNDGHADLIVGAPFNDNNGPESGLARVFSGANGTVLYSFYGDATNDFFGRAVSGAGDVNADGFDDLLVAAPLNETNGPISGSAYIFSGASGATLKTIYGYPSDYLGVSVSGVGDVNADGLADFIVSSLWDDRGGNNAGSARVYYSVLTAPPPPACPGDLTADNTVDVDDLNQVLSNWLSSCP